MSRIGEQRLYGCPPSRVRISVKFVVPSITRWNYKYSIIELPYYEAEAVGWSLGKQLKVGIIMMWAAGCGLHTPMMWTAGWEWSM